ncbi:MAG: hypothetical protein SFV23_12980 [Planctomycetaceae bacterium]|nr:hypothetical protein [Planctomycetaceae bacterium]
MSRFKRWEELERKLPDMTAAEIRAELPFWTARMQHMWGPAVKPYQKWLHQLERALDLKERDEAGKFNDPLESQSTELHD